MNDEPDDTADPRTTIHDLVQTIARSLHVRLPRHVELDELIAAGNLGWMQARARWRPQADASFRTFASYRVRGAMLDLIRKQARAARDVASIGFVAAEELVDEHGETAHAVPDHGAGAALRSRLGSIATAQWLSHAAAELLEPAADDSPLAAAIANEETERLHAALRTLDDEQRELLRLIHAEGLSLAEIGELRGRDKSVVCRQHHAALDRLRQELCADRRTAPQRA